MTKYKLLVLTDPVAGEEDAYNDWYTNRHVHDVASLPGFVSAQRFKLVREVLGEAKNTYLAIYDIEANSVDEDVDRMLNAAGSDRMPTCDSLDMTRVESFLFEEITPLVFGDS